MAKVVKDVLYPGTYHLANGRTVTYTPQDVRNLNDRMAEMLSQATPIPFSLEHDDEARPTKNMSQLLADKTRNTIGWVEETRITPEGFMENVLEVPDEEDVKRLPKIRFVSPQIEDDAADGEKRVWPGRSIVHIAATSRPIQKRQKPFAAKLSAAGKNVVRLSLGDVMAEENEAIEGEEEGAGKAKYLAEVVEALKADGYHLPDDTTMENFVDRLHTACLTKTGGKQEEKKDEEPTEVAQSPIMMSLQKRADVMEARALKAERDNIVTRINGLSASGRITKPIKDKLLKEVNTVKLSLSETGELSSNDLATKVAAFEELPAGHSWPTRMSAESKITEVDPPDGKPDDKEVLAIADRLSGGRASALRNGGSK